MDSLGVDTLWSWSRLNMWHISKYCYYLQYIKREKQILNNIYSHLGGAAHDILEKYYAGEIEYGEMIDEFKMAWNCYYELNSYRFDRNDPAKDKIIANKYQRDLEHFFTHHKKFKESIVLEDFLLIKLSDEVYLQGYADAILKDNNRYTVIDWKTSTIYTGDKKNNEVGQLVLYCLALHQKGIPLENISAGWNFLKYVNVTFTLNNGSKKTRRIERYKFGESLKSTLKTIMKRLGYLADEIQKCINIIIEDNSLDRLPPDVQSEFLVEDCIVYVDINEKTIKEWQTKLLNVVNEIQESYRRFCDCLDDIVFYDSEETLKKNEYFLSTLSGFSPEQNICFKKYLERKNIDLSVTTQEEKNDMDELINFLKTL